MQRLSIDALASALREPGRLVGMHFFNPAPAMRLVEVVTGLRSDPRAARSRVSTPLRVAAVAARSLRG